jgi:hypothetical protein
MLKNLVSFVISSKIFHFLEKSSKNRKWKMEKWVGIPENGKWSSGKLQVYLIPMPPLQQ